MLLLKRLLRGTQALTSLHIEMANSCTGLSAQNIQQQLTMVALRLGTILGNAKLGWRVVGFATLYLSMFEQL